MSPNEKNADQGQGEEHWLTRQTCDEQLGGVLLQAIPAENACKLCSHLGKHRCNVFHMR